MDQLQKHTKIWQYTDGAENFHYHIAVSLAMQCINDCSIVVGTRKCQKHVARPDVLKIILTNKAFKFLPLMCFSKIGSGVLFLTSQCELQANGLE